MDRTADTVTEEPKQTRPNIPRVPMKLATAEVSTLADLGISPQHGVQ